MTALKAASLVIAILALSACGTSSVEPETGDKHATRRVVALLDYVAADYGGAVKNGAVVDEAEYREQLAFLSEASERLVLLPAAKRASRDEVLTAIQEATQLASMHGEPAAVAAAVRRARGLLIANYGVRLGPSAAPSSERGRELFAQHCVSCHGVSGGGDGPSAMSLRPRPRSFRDPEITATLSPVRAFNAVTDGVPGTAMVPLTALSDADRWSLAFQVTALRHDPALAGRGRTDVEAAPALAALDYSTLADLRDVDLEARMQELSVPVANRAAALAFLRAIAPFQARGSIADVRRTLVAAKHSYSIGDAESARHRLTEAYLDGFEPLEARLLVTAPELVRRIEDQFLALREARSMSAPRFETDVDTLLVQLEAVEARLRGTTSPWSTGLAAFVVVVREGVESVLLVMLLLGLAKRAGAGGDPRAVHIGWGTAIAAGVVTWLASAAVVALGGGNRELVEGIVALLAVVVLLYAGHFVLARMDAQRRIAALKRRFASISSRRRWWMLFAFSFVAAYREAFEVVLFLRAILVGSPEGSGALAAGAGLGLASCIAIVVLTARVGRRLNATVLLNVGGALLCILAFVLAGKGVRSLQEAGLVGVSTFAGPRLDPLGVFPTLQTGAAQVAVLAIVVVITLLAPRAAKDQPTSPPKETAA